MVEFAADRTRDVDEHAIDRGPAAFVPCEAQMKHVAEDAAGLRDTEAEDAFERGGEGAIATGPGNGSGIAQGEQTRAAHFGVAGRVRDQVEEARLEFDIVFDLSRRRSGCR